MALIVRITIKASHHRDEDCNDFTLARTFDYRLSEWPDHRRAAEIKRLCREVIADYTEAYPYQGRDAGTPFIDATMTEGHREEMAAAA
jgi:hypothetical protein